MEAIVSKIIPIILGVMLSSCVLQRLVTTNELRYSYYKSSDCRQAKVKIIITPVKVTTNFLYFKLIVDDDVVLDIQVQSAGGVYIGDGYEVRFINEVEGHYYGRPMTVEITGKQNLKVSNFNICLN
jgi:hypothetical protein